MHSLTFQSQSQLQSQHLKKITKPSIQIKLILLLSLIVYLYINLDN